MNTDLCPDRNILEKLLLGDLPADQRESLGEHLMNCEKCAATAETLSLSDDLTAAIRTRRVFAEDDGVLAEVIERGKRLSSEIDPVESQATIVVDQSSEDETQNELGPDAKETDSISEDDYDFLHPPQKPDEIGRLGGYRVLEVLGIGGMGVVFRAEDLQLERIVALKAMIPVVFGNRSAKERFLKEARATASIEHDNIVQIYQVGEDRDVPFIAMQFLRGESLKSRLIREKQLDQREVVRIGREVASGLSAAHQRNLIHRDIKPENIWIEAETGRVRILDFGLVRNISEDGGITQTGIVLGTPRYMAPEQAQGHELDYRCDLFSLGSVLYHLLTGKAPFDGANLTSTLMAVAHTDPAPIDRVAPQLHPGLSKLIAQLLSKDRERRPQSAAEVVTALAAVERDLEAGYVPERDATEELTVITEPISNTAAAGEPVDVIKTAAGGKRRPPRRRTALWMGGAFGVFLLLGVITFATAKGTVTIDVPPEMKDDVIVNIYGEHDKVEVLNKQNHWSVKLAGGEYSLKVNGGNNQFHLQENTITVTRFGRRVLHMSYTPNESKTTSPPSVDKSWQNRLPPDAPPPAIAPFNGEEAKRHQEAWAEYLGLPVEKKVDLGDGVKMSFMLIPPGEFKMGKDAGQTSTQITQPFYLGTTEVTQAQFKAIMKSLPKEWGKRPDSKAGPDFPASWCRWGAVHKFCDSLTSQERQAGRLLHSDRFRLPTEAEWEYACRAGSQDLFSFGSDIRRLGDYAWYEANTTRVGEGFSHPVGQKQPNAWGLFDMHGNLKEWCDSDYDLNPSAANADNLSHSSLKVVRGGSWFHPLDDYCQCGTRESLGTNWATVDTGFRVVLPVDAFNPPNNFTLSFDGKDDYVEIPNPPEWRDGPLTLELTVHSELVGQRLPAVLELAGLKVRMNRGGFQWMFIAYGPAERNALIGEPFMPLQQKLKELSRDQHLAAVYDQHSISLFVNGQLRDRAPLADDFILRAVSETGDIGTGSISAADSFFTGTIDEVRISNTVRYTEDYTPAERLESDEHTLALYHFDESQGDVLKDASGNGYDGKIFGAKWMLKDHDRKLESALPTEPNRPGATQPEPKWNPEAPLKAPKPLQETTDE